MQNKNINYLFILIGLLKINKICNSLFYLFLISSFYFLNLMIK
ncbi:hypothetical protein HMPREF3221_00572 [Fusobacterium nucleatum]|uniref:Uncharacterized protein n=1 Tax=Fusobacterium nucleatum TaxID=851 RepID=A0A133P5U4_FUSNU|nr:hypothetical protein HMPREF3221_00572 [Fusobacterium nucleatum]